MLITGKGFWLLVLISACMLLSAWLPACHKLWFVSETGNVSHGQTLNVLMILLLFGRWRHAITLALFVNGLQFLIGALRPDGAAALRGTQGAERLPRRTCVYAG
jgi:hypothetical protein